MSWECYFECCPRCGRTLYKCGSGSCIVVRCIEVSCLFQAGWLPIRSLNNAYDPVTPHTTPGEIWYLLTWLAVTGRAVIWSELV